MSVWIWVIASVIIGMVMFTLFVQIMSYITISRDKENARATIGEFAATINSFCEARIGEKTVASFSFPTFVDLVFVSKDGINYKEGSITFGRYLCIRMGKEISCERLNCDLELKLIRKKSTFLSWTDRIFGANYQEYVFEITKTAYGVSALEPGMKSESECTSLMKCKGKTMAAYLSLGIVVLTDFTPIYECCDQPTLAFLKNTATFLNGSKILIIWEGLSTDPTSPKYEEMTNMLSTEGFQVSSFRHKERIAFTKNYNQVWIFVPGFCSTFDKDKKTAECKDVIRWNDDEVKEIKDFVDGGGKLLLVSDYTPFTSQSIANDILDQLDYTSKFDDGCSCGCAGKEEKTTEIVSHPLTQGIKTWSVKAGIEFIC